MHLGRVEMGDIIAGALALILLWVLAYLPQLSAAPQRDGASVVSHELLDATADELAGRVVLNANRRHVGTVDFIARGVDDGRLYAVVAPGGTVDRLVVVGLDQVYPQRDRLVMYAPVSRADLLHASPYLPEQLDPVQADLRIGQLEGVRGGPQPSRVVFMQGERLGGLAGEQRLPATGDFRVRTDPGADLKHKAREFAAFEVQPSDI